MIRFTVRMFVVTLCFFAFLPFPGRASAAGWDDVFPTAVAKATVGPCGVAGCDCGCEQGAPCCCGTQTSSPLSATLSVQVPPGAVVEIEGTPTSATGPLRKFFSPPLLPGKPYSYDVACTYNGTTRRQAVEIRGGRETVVAFTHGEFPYAAPERYYAAPAVYATRPIFALGGLRGGACRGGG